MIRSAPFRVALTVLALAACAKDPTGGKPLAEVAEARPQAPAAAAAETLDLTPANTRVGWVGAKITAQHSGSFADLRGTLALVDGKPERSRVEVEIATASITEDDDNAKLVGHLKSPDFFDVATYPTARFVSTEIVPTGADYRVTGNLELHGVTRSVTFPAKIEVTPAAVRVEAELGINRHDWKISYPGARDDLIKDNVLIKLAIDAPRAANKS